MTQIDVVAGADGEYRVVISDGDSSTDHTVIIPDGYPGTLGVPEDDEALIRASFEFLLEREPKESIMQRFELPVIARYFPEYPGEIARRLG